MGLQSCLELPGRSQPSRLGLWQKDTLNDLGSTLRNLFAHSHGQVHSNTAYHSSMCTKRDVPYALSVTNRYQACAKEAHWSSVKTILKYLRRTKDMFLIYGGGELILECYSDTSFQLDDDDDDSKSQSGFVFKLNGGVVAWKSSKQATTGDSTKEVDT
ncbi:Secreted RxLR effector protein [Sesamum angolense]|uniref:Secreted RxLR effector protein n=1 Tax=Sesamum angolense TaxID=2727404 RepID=A0AAE1W3K2_9LAMI|nr:Secreted RxLR effector protein [Sesamum angolense]